MIVCVFLNLFGEKSIKREIQFVSCGGLEDWFTGDQQENLDALIFPTGECCNIVTQIYRDRSIANTNITLVCFSLTRVDISMANDNL
jgi:hypothetical protein